jgi:membrane associated rhomboid family serine protease
MASSFRDELKQTFRSGDTLNILLLVNLIVFLFINILEAFLKLLTIDTFVSGTLLNILSVPAALSKLIMQPWTLITYQFLHYNFLHILFNLLWLFWMGKIFAEYLGNKKLLSTYILGGIAGAIFFIVFYNVFPLFRKELAIAQALGASASVLAITIAIAAYIPDYTLHLILIGPVKLKYIALATVVLDLIGMSGGNAGGHIAHLGGALYGYIFAMNLKSGKNIASWFDRMADGIKNLFSRKGKMKVVKKARPLTDDEYLHNKKASQERVDSILDKISRSGYGSLTAEERDILFNYSNKK